MNTHDKYELPTLPEPFTYTRPERSEGALFHAGHMQEYARAAIEADRKKFGRNENDRENDKAPESSRSEPQWVSPSNAMPDYYQDVYVKRNDGVVRIARLSKGEGGYWQLATFLPGNKHGYAWKLDEAEAWCPIAFPQPLSESDIPAEPVSRDVEALVRLLEDGEWAEHVARTPLGWRLELAITTLVGEASKPYNEPVNTLSDAEIREVFLANGFTIKDGHDDLKPYVYDAARALFARYGNTQQEK